MSETTSAAYRSDAQLMRFALDSIWKAAKGAKPAEQTETNAIITVMAESALSGDRTRFAAAERIAEDTFTTTPLSHKSLSDVLIAAEAFAAALKLQLK